MGEDAEVNEVGWQLWDAGGGEAAMELEEEAAEGPPVPVELSGCSTPWRPGGMGIREASWWVGFPSPDLWVGFSSTDLCRLLLSHPMSGVPALNPGIFHAHSPP